MDYEVQGAIPKGRQRKNVERGCIRRLCQTQQLNKGGMGGCYGPYKMEKIS